LLDLIDVLGYRRPSPDSAFGHHDLRTLVFVGDLVDRGPNSPAVLRLVMDMVTNGSAICVSGNHDDKLRRKLDGRDVRLSHGLLETMLQLENESELFVDDVFAFLRDLPHHYVLDDGRLVVAHAGLSEELHGRDSTRVRAFALFGPTTGVLDELGLPTRLDWAADYRGQAMVVYGHTPVETPVWKNNTICIDTGCVFGGALTALRYPERTLVKVKARQRYCDTERAFLASNDE
jgi:protein phosphatase